MKWRQILLISTVIGISVLSQADDSIDDSSLTTNTTVQTEDSGFFSNLFSMETLSNSIQAANQDSILAAASLMPSTRVALKKKMFEIQLGYGHSSSSLGTDHGVSLTRPLSPQADIVSYQLGYGITNSTNLALSGTFNRVTETIEHSNYEGPSEPTISIFQSFKNRNVLFNLGLGYQPDLGAQTRNHAANQRIEGNALNGGASYRFNGALYNRFGLAILGGETEYIFKDTRVRNTQIRGLYTTNVVSQGQSRFEGGHEKTLRLLAEMAFPIRFGFGVGRTWIEQEELQQSTAVGYTLYNAYTRDFIQTWARFQIDPHFSVLPQINYYISSNTNDDTGNRDQEFIASLSLRYRF